MDNANFWLNRVQKETDKLYDLSLKQYCKQSSKVHTFSPANAHFFSASFLAGNGLVVS